MANKLILVPEDLYRGLTSSITSTGEPNLDLVKRELDNVRRRRDSKGVKNANYNQELRRYLNLRNERENRPVKVEVVDKSKGIFLPKTNSRPATYIASGDDDFGNDDDNDFWMSDDFSFTKQRPKYSPLISPPPPPIPPHGRNIKIKPPSPPPVPPRDWVKKVRTPLIFNRNPKRKREEENSLEERKLIKTKKEPNNEIMEEIEKRNIRKLKNKLKKEREDNRYLESFRERKEKKRQHIIRKQDIKKSRVPYMPSDLINRSIKSEHINESLNAPLISQPHDAIGKVKTPIIKREIREEIPEEKRRIEKRKLHYTEEGYPDVPVKKRKLRIINNWAQRRPSKANIQRKIWAQRKPTQSDINRFKPGLW
ncbi:unnamed protein product [Meloidogyne enterolobii]|uniref:Uncharacterized protein n=2 Tax=Meloidogyne enterolobii TaxID=390850 RepID=A0A6V7YCE8_MELEN|nr:unnamed protein product [Meloidogyne enterolobii]CAD2209343.1 unnamed protein product [Meloidogyne enterolobii]